MRKIAIALILSTLCTGWGWGTPSVPACNDDETDGQLTLVILQSIGLEFTEDTTAFKIKFLGKDTGDTVSADIVDEQMQVEFSLHRETKFENNIRHCEVNLAVDITKLKEEKLRLAAFGLAAIAGTIPYTIQVTDDGTKLWTAAIGEE